MAAITERNFLLDKCLCTNRHCGWAGTYGDLLTAPDPFNEGELLYACPKCRQMEHQRACDEAGCTREATFGSTATGEYRWTCYEHRPL